MKKIKNKKFHYFYKITNLINNHFYYGIHSTDDLEDGYMGSGSRLHRAYEKYGIENFEKEILKFFDSREELESYESFIVNEDLIKCNECYNVSLGGYPNKTINTVLIKDDTGKCYRVYKDLYYTNTEFKHPSSGMVVAFDNDNNMHYITSDEYKNNKNLYHIYNYNKSSVIDNNGNKLLISKDEFNANRDKYTSVHKGMCLVKDKNGNAFCVSIDDERYKSGELVSFWLNRKHTNETKMKIKTTMNLHNHQQGEKNSQYGTCWINNGLETIKIHKSKLEEYLNNGYTLGRFIKNKENLLKANQNKIWLNKDGKTKLLYINEIEQYIADGWLYGRVSKLLKKSKQNKNFKIYNDLYKKIFNKDYEIL